MTIGERIRKLRRERNWTQVELGQRVGIDKRNISRYESGRLTPSARTLRRFAEAFGLDPDELAAEKPARPELALTDPELLRLFQDIATLPEGDRTAVKTVLNLIVKQHRVQQLLAG